MYTSAGSIAMCGYECDRKVIVRFHFVATLGGVGSLLVTSCYGFPVNASQCQIIRQWLLLPPPLSPCKCNVEPQCQ